jgi:hypothetical protein
VTSADRRLPVAVLQRFIDSTPKARPVIAQATFGILLLASFILCYFAAQRWHWSHVFVGEVLFLSSLLFVFLAADVLRMNEKVRADLNRVEQTLERTEPLVRAIESGSRDPSTISSLEAQEVPVVYDTNPDNPNAMLGTGALDHQVGMITRLVGRKWEEVVPQGAPNPQSGEVTVKVELPDPHGMEQNAVVYVFEQGEPALPDPAQGRQYLGEFRVNSVAGNLVKIEPVGTVDSDRAARLGGSRGPWIVYENMPIDQHPDGLLQIFAGIEGDDWSKAVPGPVIEEYRRHGTEAQPDDDQWHRVGLDADGNVVGIDDWDEKAVRFEYRRELRDYSYLFTEYSKRWIELLADRAALVEQNKKLAATLASARELQAFREDEQQKLRFDLAGIKKDRAAVEAHLAALEASLANARDLLTATLDENLVLARQLATTQRELTRAINAVTEPTPPRAADGISVGP